MINEIAFVICALVMLYKHWTGDLPGTVFFGIVSLMNLIMFTHEYPV